MTPEKLKYDPKKVTYTQSTQSLEQERLSNTFMKVKTDHVPYQRRKKAKTQNLRATSYDIRGPPWIWHPSPLQSVTTVGINRHTLQASASPHFHFSLFLFLSLLELFATMSGANRKYMLRHIFYFLTTMQCTVQRFTTGKQQSMEKGLSIQNKKGESFFIS